MTENDETQVLLASLKGYLEDLRETGVDGLPYPKAVAVADQAPGMKEVAAVAGGIRETLEEIRFELGECGRCGLGRTRTNLVFGVGNPAAPLVFVGEAPGRDEDLQGEPFVGEAGQILNRIITRMGLDRSDVYICNVLKCRPPGNRNPEHAEIEQCGPFMLRQVKAIAPKVVMSLDKEALEALEHYQWPGNVRELENIVERTVALTEGNQITFDDLPSAIRTAASTRVHETGVDLTKMVNGIERKMIAEALALSNGVKARAAAMLKLNRTTLVEKMRRLGM